MKAKNYHIYINKEAAKKVEIVFTEMQRKGLFGKQETPEGKLASIISYSLDMTIKGNKDG